MPEPTWMTNIQHDRTPRHPGELEGFIELRRPRVPGPETRYEPRPAPTITMFAAEIRTQPCEPDRLWLKPEDLQRGTASSSAKRRRNAQINRQAAGAMRRLTEQQAGEIRHGLAEIVEAGRLMGTNEEESE